MFKKKKNLQQYYLFICLINTFKHLNFFFYTMLCFENNNQRGWVFTIQNSLCFVLVCATRVRKIEWNLLSYDTYLLNKSLIQF